RSIRHQNHARRAAAIALLIAFATCAGLTVLRARAQNQQPAARTLYFVHGRIYTNDPQRPWASAMAVREGKIACIGGLEVLLECGAGQEGAESIQLANRFVMPGFNDAHVHLGSAGADMLAVGLNGAPTVEELQRRVAAAVAEHKDGEWITGRGWDHTLWPDKKFPNKQQLDSVPPKNPVLLTHVSGHVAVANSLALKLAGVDREMSNPRGGQIERDASGDPTGMLEEGSAIDLVSRKVPDLTADQRRRGMEMVLADAARNGVTSVQDNSDWQDFLLFRTLKDE